MGAIDSDTHVDETEATWGWMDESELQFKPRPDAPANPDPARPPMRYWIIDGHRQPRFHRNNQVTRTTVETRELLDPLARLRDMDEMGTDVQVIYPTTFLVGVTENAEAEIAVKRSYNRWLADRCGQSSNMFVSSGRRSRRSMPSTRWSGFGVPRRFPGVRWGFIETGASWVPYVVYNHLRSLRRLRREGSQDGHSYDHPSDVVRLNNFYIACQADEDLPYILQYTGEDRLLIGSDYTHPDAAQEFNFPQLLQDRADRGEISQFAVRKITHDNAQTFYGL